MPKVQIMKIGLESDHCLYAKVALRRNPFSVAAIRYHKAALFNPWSWFTKPPPKNCNDLNRMKDTDLEKCAANFPEAYVVQYHTQVWRYGTIKR